MKAKRLVIWVSLVFALDQLSKWLISQWIPLGNKVAIIPNIFDLVYVTNKGAAFGFLAGLADPYRFIILTLVSVIAVLLISYYYWTLPATNSRMQIPLALILGGGLWKYLRSPLSRVGDRFLVLSLV